MKNKIFSICCLTVTLMTAKPPALLNFGASCYVNAIIQSLNATIPLQEIITDLEFKNPFAQNFQKLIAAIKTKDKPNIALFNFYQTLVTTFLSTEKTLTKKGEISTQEGFGYLSPLEIEEQKRAFERFEQLHKRQPHKKSLFPDIEKAIQESLKTHRQERGQATTLAQDISRATGQSIIETERLLDQVRRATQQDAHEFLTQLIDALRGDDSNSETYAKITKKFFYSIKEEFRQPYIGSILPLPTYHANTPIRFSLQKGAYTILAEIERYKSLEDCFDSYFQSERFTKIAPILIISLNRFAYATNHTTHEQKTIKLSHDIAIPITFDISKYSSEELQENFEEDENRKNYDLYAVIVHKGPTAGSGHYVAYVKENNQWYLCDDTRISLKTEGEVNRDIVTNAYILFYQRRTVRTPEIIIEEGREKETIHKPVRPIQEPYQPKKPLSPIKKVTPLKERRSLINLLEDMRFALTKLLSLL